MAFVQNLSKQDFIEGRFTRSENCILIQIEDPPGNFYASKVKFQNVFQYEFFDLEDDDFAEDPEMKVQYPQAKQIYDNLLFAKDNNLDVVVHCYAGISRSGAIADMAVRMGFTDKGKNRNRNRNNRLFSMLRFAELERKHGDVS